MNYSYFLAANSANGFYSIYDSFPPGEDDFLHIIKGGPGSGKSGFMKKVGRAAEEKGLNVHYVLCSGDPDSLDGLYIPALKQAWVDGTNPHVREPSVYGVNSDYVNLSQFFSNDLSCEEKYYVNLYASAYKADYAAAYKLLSAASQLENFLMHELELQITFPDFSAEIEDILKACPEFSVNEAAAVSYRFLSCISCKGDYRLYSEIVKLCKFIYVIQSSFGLDRLFLNSAAEFARAAGEKLLICPSPQEPEHPSALIFPERKLCIADGSWNFEGSSPIDADKKLSALPDGVFIHKADTVHRLRDIIFSMAYDKLADAKRNHDMLEEKYHSHIDFSSLSEFTASEIKRILN